MARTDRRSEVSVEPNDGLATSGRWSVRSLLGGAAPGLALCVAIAAGATALGGLAPVVGAPVVAIVLGAAWKFGVGVPASVTRGVATATGPALKLAVILLGAQLSIVDVATVGFRSLPVMIGTLVVCLATAAVVGRRLRIELDLRTLVGVGTAICGASAIAAVSPIIRARGADVAYAVSTIFLFNVAAVLAFPPLGHVLGMSQTGFGLFAGTAVNDMSSVVAAASGYGHVAAQHAVVVKLVRTLMIIPVCLGLAVLVRRRDARAGIPQATAPARTLRPGPWFLAGFLVVVAANTAGLIPADVHRPLSRLVALLITIALAGIGLSTDLSGIRRAGPRPIALGFILWVTVTGASLLLQWATV